MIWNDDPSVEVIPGEPIAYMYCLPRPDRAAFWAPTQAEYRTATAIQSWNPNVPLALDSDEVATICALYADLLAERLPSIPERYLNAIRNQTGGYVEVLPAGYVHNVLAAGVFLVLLISLTGIPRWEREARARYRMGKGLCPACRYDLRGKLDAGCSECGWNRPK